MSRHEVMLKRCDRCGAEAKAKATWEGLELLFCKHHADQYEQSLAEIGFIVESLVPQLV